MILMPRRSIVLRFGRDWTRIEEHVGTRTPKQVIIVGSVVIKNSRPALGRFGKCFVL
jgi:hypothetical protein